MFKMKAKNHTIKSFRNSLMEGRDILSDRVSDGMKYAQDQIVYIGDYVGKNPNISFIKHRLMKHPTSGLMTVAGLGLIIYGLFRMAKK
ncbi:MAG: hypothetical protein PHC34_12680 [Candidatus Gastranaerophilales bacterium]|nr:hypothetical protein [Candidatus Gastranaerophilales bacterium]